MNLAPDIPQNGYRTLGSGEFNNRRLLACQPSFSFQDLSEKRENSVLIGREYLNRTNHPVDLFVCFRTKQLELGSVNWNVYYPYRGIFQLRRSLIWI
uniref:Uncharacterized protein n=1 Tax=Fagonia indica TaxID=66629 RepID=A0A6C0UA12_9ROSI|nr:hypothetical protein [Fagonia indica]